MLKAPSGGLFNLLKGQKEQVPRDRPSPAAGGGAECSPSLSLQAWELPLPSGWLLPSPWGVLQSCLLPSSPSPPHFLGAPSAGNTLPLAAGAHPNTTESSHPRTLSRCPHSRSRAFPRFSHSTLMPRQQTGDRMVPEGPPACPSPTGPRAPGHRGHLSVPRSGRPAPTHRVLRGGKCVHDRRPGDVLRL